MYGNTIYTQTVSGNTTHVKKFVSLGELHCSSSPTQFWTVLGSCVSVVLHNPRKRISMVCHAQISQKDTFGKFNDNQQKYVSKACDGDFRFVETAIMHMLEKFYSNGVDKNEIQAGVYGGASVIAEFSHKIGDENVSAALKLLNQQGIRIIEKNVGGEKSRTIRHFSDTGLTQVKIL